MVKDAEEALKRLEEELKGVEEPKVPPEEDPKPSLEDILNDEELNRLLNGQDIGQAPAAYENDNQDTRVVKLDLEQISEEEPAELPEEEEEPQEKRKVAGIVLMLVALGLMTVVTGVIAWMLLKL